MTLDEHREKENPATLSQAVRQRVLDRDNYQCVACGMGGENRLQLHHILFRSQGGTHVDENLCTLCKNCHDDVHAGLLAVAYIEWYPGLFSFFCSRALPPFRWRNFSRVSA